jgi:hypothetical protein
LLDDLSLMLWKRPFFALFNIASKNFVNIYIGALMAKFDLQIIIILGDVIQYHSHDIGDHDTHDRSSNQCDWLHFPLIVPQ